MIHLHFHVGDDRDAHRMLRDRLVRLGATPKESFIVEQIPALQTGCVITIPISLKEELTSHALLGLRLLDDLDVEPCSAQLERVVAHCASNGSVHIAELTDRAAWLPAPTGYTASYPGTIEVHHVVKFPKQGTEPPIALAELMKMSQALNVATWSIFAKRDLWCFRSAKPMKIGSDIAAMLRRDRTKLAAIFKDVAPRAEISITVEEVLATWSYPLRPTDDNRSRVSLRQMTGTSDRRLPNFSDVCAQCKQTTGQKLLVKDESARSRIITNIEPFRRIAIAQGFNPLIIGIGLIPANSGADGAQLADYFCTQSVAYGNTREEAETLLEAYRSAIWFLVHSGYSPLMSHPDTYEHVSFWSSVLPGSNSQRKNGRTPQPVLAAGEQVFSIAPARQYKRVEEVIQLLTSSIRHAGLLVVPFRTGAGAGGEHLRGCLFALVTGPQLDESRLQHLAACQSIMLHRTPLKPATAHQASPLKDKVRHKQAIDHNKLQLALEELINKPRGSRMTRMAATFPETFALFDEYPQLETIKADIEHTTKLTAVIETAWTIMTGTDRRRLYYWRKQAGLPSRRPR